MISAVFAVAILDEEFLRKIFTKNQTRPGVEECRLDDLLNELGFLSEQFSSPSSRILEKCVRNIRSETELIRFFWGKSAHNWPGRQVVWRNQLNLIADHEREVKRIACSSSTNARLEVFPESLVEGPEVKLRKVRRSINYIWSLREISVREWNIFHLSKLNSINFTKSVDSGLVYCWQVSKIEPITILRVECTW